MTKRPELLKKGDKIGIVATARKISIEELSASIKLFVSWDLVPIIGKKHWCRRKSICWFGQRKG